MLTLQKDKTSTEIVELHKRSTRSKKPHGVVYYSHNTKASGNVAPAAGVLARRLREGFARVESAQFSGEIVQ